MREYWANVYAPEPGVDSVGAPYPDAVHADENACRNRYARIHVRLKPEGAPKRYATEANRRAWEMWPQLAAFHASRGDVAACSRDGRRIWLA